MLAPYLTFIVPFHIRVPMENNTPHNISSIKTHSFSEGMSINLCLPEYKKQYNIPHMDGWIIRVNFYTNIYKYKINFIIHTMLVWEITL